MNDEMEKLKAIGIDLPEEIGEVKFVEKFNPHLFKNITYLKLVYLAAFISLLFFTKYHLQTNEPEPWNSDTSFYWLVFWLCVVGMIFLIKWFLGKSDVKIAGVNGFIVYRFRFSGKYPKKTFVFYDDIERLIQYERSNEWWRYDFIQNNKVIYSAKVYLKEQGDDDLDFMDHILEHWNNSVEKKNY